MRRDVDASMVCETCTLSDAWLLHSWSLSFLVLFCLLHAISSPIAIYLHSIYTCLPDGNAEAHLRRELSWKVRKSSKTCLSTRRGVHGWILSRLPQYSRLEGAAPLRLRPGRRSRCSRAS